MRLGLSNQTAWSYFRRIVVSVLTSVQIETERGLETTALGYCMECRKKVEIRNPKQAALKNKRPAVQDVCPKCGNKVFRISEA
jgi:hypothetical protein